MAAARLEIPETALTLLAAVEEVGGLSDAARVVGISQPAASKALAKAEAACGVALVRRDARPLTLTAEGRAVAEHARRRATLDQALATHLAAVKTQGRGVVRIASFGSSASTRVLPPLLERVRRVRPELRAQITETTDDEAAASLRDGRAEFAIVVTQAPEGEMAADLDVVALAEDRLIALLPESDAASVRAATPASLSGRPFIMSKIGSEPLIRRWFAAAGRAPDVRHEIRQMTSILALVRADMGVSVVAETAVPARHEGVAVVPLDPPAPRTVALARRSGGFPSRAAELFWRHVEETAL